MAVPDKARILEQLRHYAGNLTGEVGRDSIADLMILLRAIAAEIVIIGERLQPRCFADREASALQRVRMDEIVPVLRDVRRDCRGGLIPDLHLEAVTEAFSGSQPVSLVMSDVAVPGKKLSRPFLKLRTDARRLCDRRSISVAGEITRHVRACFMLDHAAETRVVKPA